MKSIGLIFGLSLWAATAIAQDAPPAAEAVASAPVVASTEFIPKFVCDPISPKAKECFKSYGLDLDKPVPEKDFKFWNQVASWEVIKVFELKGSGSPLESIADDKITHGFEVCVARMGIFRRPAFCVDAIILPGIALKKEEIVAGDVLYVIFPNHSAAYLPSKNINSEARNATRIIGKVINNKERCWSSGLFGGGAGYCAKDISYDTYRMLLELQKLTPRPKDDYIFEMT